MVSYRRFSHDNGGFGNSMNYYSFGVKWRTGPGAAPGRDGFFYGVGLAVSVITDSINATSDKDAGLDGIALGGINFAKTWYVELSYRTPPDAKATDTNNLALALGYRF